MRFPLLARIVARGLAPALLLLSTAASAQQVDVGHADLEKMHSLPERAVTRFPVLITPDHVVQWERAAGGPGAGKLYAQVFDHKGAKEFAGEFEFPEGNGNTRPVRYVVRDDGTWIIYNVFRNKGSEHHVYAAKVELPAFKLGPPVELATIPDVPNLVVMPRSGVPYEVRVSPDGRTTAVYFDRNDRKKNIQPVHVKVFDASFAPLWARDFVLEHPAEVRSVDVHVSNEGVVHALLEARKYKNGASLTDPDQPHLLVRFTADGETSHLLPYNTGMACEAIALDVDAAGNAYVAGFGTPARSTAVTGFVDAFDATLAPKPIWKGKITGMKAPVELCSYVHPEAGPSYLVGISNGFQTIALDPTGKELWQKHTDASRGSVCIEPLKDGLVAAYNALPKDQRADAPGPLCVGRFDAAGQFNELQRTNIGDIQPYQPDDAAYDQWMNMGLLATSARMMEKSVSFVHVH